MHPVWSPTHSEPTSEEFVARCLLGAGWVSGTRRLSMLDLRVWAALCAMLREQWSAAPDDDPTLDRVSSRTVGTTGYQLADAAIGSEGGAQWPVPTAVAAPSQGSRDHRADRGAR